MYAGLQEISPGVIALQAVPPSGPSAMGVFLLPNTALQVFSAVPNTSGWGDVSLQRTTSLDENAVESAGIFLIRYGNPTSAYSGRLAGIDITGAVPTGNAQNFTGTIGVSGIIAGAVHGGSGTTSNLSAIVTDVWALGPTTNARHIYLGTEANIANGTGTYIGLDIQTMSKATNNYGIRIQKVTPGYGIWVSSSGLGQARARFDDLVSIYGVENTSTLLTLGAGGAFGGSGTLSNGITVTLTGGSAATSDIIGLNMTVATQAASFTCTSLIGILINTPTIGAGSTVTTSYGLYINTQSGGGTNNYGLYVAGATGTGAASVYVAAGDLLMPSGVATNATAGFLYMTGGAGAPSGTPANAAASQIPLYFDTTDHRLYFYESGGWHYVARTA